MLKLRTGSFFPGLLAPRRRVDVALHAAIMESYVQGVSTRKVDDLVAALGVDTEIPKPEVSRICTNLVEQVAAYDTHRSTTPRSLSVPRRYLLQGPYR